MDRERIAAMAMNVARSVSAVDGEDEKALANVDGAVDAMIAGIQTIEENLPGVRADTVPEKAAKEAIQELLDEAIKPYLADLVKALESFGG